jgi:hypothetical protein
MPVTANTILTRVRSQLIDDGLTRLPPGPVRWTDDELLRWLSDGQRTLVAMDPALGEITAPLALSQGTKQVLPVGAFMLLDIKRNMGTDGETPGRVVTVVTRENLDRVDPNWHASLRSDVTLHYVYDPKQPRVYYVYPPSTGLNYLDVSRAASPADFTAMNDVMTVPDLYQTALFDYVMFRAHQKDTDYAAGNDKAQAYLGLFQMFVGGHTQAVVDESPNRQLGEPNLQDKGAAA